MRTSPVTTVLPRRGFRHAVAAVAASAALLAVAPPVFAARAASLSLYVSFFPNGSISLATPDGTAIGTTSGSPTVIPAGYYSLVFSGPGGCSVLPNFHLSGPGVNLVSNMTEAQGQKNAPGVDFLPSSTYTWFDDAIPGVIHTFVTSAQVEGSPPTPGTTDGTSSTSTGKHVTSQDIVGSAVVPFRGTVTVDLTAAGKVSLAYRGRSVASLRAGRYTVKVVDESRSSGLTLQEPPRAARAVTGPAFTGKRSASVNLTAGKWLFSGAGKTARAVVVS